MNVNVASTAMPAAKKAVIDPVVVMA